MVLLEEGAALLFKLFPLSSGEGDKGGEEIIVMGDSIPTDKKNILHTI